MSNDVRSSAKVIDNKAPFLVGVVGCTDPEGYTAETDLDAMPELRDAFVGILQWIYPASVDEHLPEDQRSKQEGHLSATLRKFVRGKPCPDNVLDASGHCVEYNACWKPLALHSTPTVILTSLKPGIETLLVEAALAFRESHPSWLLQIRIVCPYDTIKQYVDSELFKTDADRQRFNNVFDSIKAIPGWDEERDFIPVPLDNDWKTGSEQGVLLDQIAFERRVAGRSIPHLQHQLRLRASGEYIASFSDLLVAVYDHPLESITSDPNDLFDASTHTIVEAKRRGLAWELIAVTNNFTWADNGPVLRMGHRRQDRKNDAPAFRDTHLHLVFEHPYDTKPEAPEKASHDDSAANNAAWQAAGDSIFRRILRLQDEFNQLRVHANVEENEINRMLRPPKDFAAKNPAMMKFANKFLPAARVRRRAADESAKLEVERKILMTRLAWLIGIAAVFLGAYEHWHSNGAKKQHLDEHCLEHFDKPAHAMEHSTDHTEREPHDEHLSLASSNPINYERIDRRIRLALIFTSLACVAAAGGFYIHYTFRRLEQKRYDYRALGEALRVQIYWALAGLNRSVASDYLQRQRDELDWIRYVACGMVFPFHRWKDGFRKLEQGSQLQLLRLVQKGWVSEQEKYFRKNVGKLEQKRHLWHWVAWSFAMAGGLQLAFMLLDEFAKSFDWAGLESYLWTAQIGLGLFGLPVAMSTAERLLTQDPHGHHPLEFHQPELSMSKESWIAWLKARWDIIGTAFLISAIVGGLRVGLPEIPGLDDFIPKTHDWWIILNGAVLLMGGLSLAWAERSFITEEHRSFSSMRMLYHSANMRLESILSQMEKLQKDSPGRKHDRERLLLEAQDVLYNLGCEHLSENADWLIYHRARPLEPFMAG